MMKTTEEKQQERQEKTGGIGLNIIQTELQKEHVRGEETGNTQKRQREEKEEKLG